MKEFFAHARGYILRGILTLIPIGLTVFTVRIIYVFIDQRVMESVDQFVGYRVPGLGLLLFIFVLYVTGAIASNVFGRKLFAVVEGIMSRIPILKTTYHVGKQLSNTLSLPEKQIFQQVVLVDYFQPGVWVVGFVTGKIQSGAAEKTLLKVFIPTVPNPTSGFLVIMEESKTINPQWSVEEAMKLVISGGIIGPERIRN